MWSESMNIKLIRNDADLRASLARLDTLWGAAPDTPEGGELDVLVLLVEKFEDEHYPIGPSDPVEAIKFRMEQQGLTLRDLEPFIGSSDRVSEVLNRKRRLSLRMVKRLHDGLNIPYESLMAGV
jgi:HTH-type transcriptional regulator/antitoxin HigA